MASSANVAVMGSNNANKHADERGWEGVGHVSDGKRVRRDPGRRMGLHEEVEKAQLATRYIIFRSDQEEVGRARGGFLREAQLRLGGDADGGVIS
jgi:hypothetical protein